MEKGQQAPFSGQLLSPNLAIDLGQKASYCDERLSLELKHTEAKLSIDLTLEKQLRGNEKLTWEAEKKLLMDRLEEAKKPPPWYTHPAFVITVTVIGTFGVTYGIFELATRIK
jgi:predicted ATPase